MFPGGTGGHCISVLKCFIQGAYNMLVEQPLVNEGSLLSIILNDFSDFFFFPHKNEQVKETQICKNELRAVRHNTSP